ncbi:creatininase family protein [Fulvivirgaceae bacterium PWU4]|uniref:Creatininase family protein n=1 Tax=Chryseosolibacter histidini TaxID=2782349 RepID=A0AAP2DP22_9BACT|nr:creatininase family protein [Chryseosolibacter histidini]MBT1699836.1 creatininase family protein [Chryseosolibacter histidini]
MRPYILAENNWKTVKETAYTLAVLPWGATEAHNYHLPYGTDIVEAEQVAAEAARISWEAGNKVVVLPCIPFGVNTGQFDVKLDMNMNPSTQLAVLRDVVDVLNRQGIYKLVILNSHGGNDFKTMIRELGLQYPKMFLCSCNWYQAVDQKQYFENKDDHAGEMETSVMMHLTPHLVRPLSEAGDGAAKKFRITAIREGWAWSERKWLQVTKDTGVGDPRKASAEKGQRYFKAVTEKVAAFFTEVAQADNNDLYA